MYVFKIILYALGIAGSIVITFLSIFLLDAPFKIIQGTISIYFLFMVYAVPTIIVYCLGLYGIYKLVLKCSKKNV